MLRKLTLLSVFMLLVCMCAKAQSFRFSEKITPADVDSARVPSDAFGASVSVSGTYAIVGATGQDWDSAGGNYKSGAGAAYIFEYQNGNWNYIKKLTPPNTDSARVASDNFGFSVAISGNYAVVGANLQDWDSAGGNYKANAGAAYIFERQNGVWGFVKKITPPNADSARVANDQFGYSVSISGNYILVGARQNDYDSAGANQTSDAGAAFVFERRNGVWGLVEKLSGGFNGSRVSTDYFGHSVSISGSYAIIGAMQQDTDSAGANSLTNSGAAYIFERSSGGDWNVANKLTSNSGRVSSDFMGCSVAIDAAGYAVAGAYQNRWDSSGTDYKVAPGGAYVFERRNGNWESARKLTSPSTDSSWVAFDNQGYSVAISGTNIAVGAFQHDYDSAGANFTSTAGAVFVYSRNGNGVWGFRRRITHPDRYNSDAFGRSVAISDTVILAAAYQQDRDSSGGNFENNAGAAYFFGAPENSTLIYNNGWANSLSPTSGTGGYTCTVQAGTATIASGASVASLTVDSGATASLAGSFNIGGDYTNNGTVSGSGKIVLNGSSAQNIYGTGTTGNLELNNSNGATIQDSLGINGVLTLTSGTLTTNGKLKLEATGAATYGQLAGTGSGTLSGSLTAEMMITGGGTGWRPVSSPVSGATLGNISDDVNLNFGTPGNAYATVYYFNEQVAPYWTIPADTSAAFGDSAFSIYMGGSTAWGNPLPLTLDIQGTYRGTSDYTFNNLTRTGSTLDTLGWNYVANPWPSGFLWDDANIIVNSGGIQGNQVWLYNQSAGAYQVFDGTDNGVVPPFSPLLFEVTSTNTSITLKNSARTTDSLVNYFDKTGLVNYVEIIVTGKDGKSDKVKFYTDAAAQNGYDIMDGNKKINPAAPNMYFVLDNKKANKEVWNTLPQANEWVSLNFSGWEKGQYTLSFITENIESNIEVELEDKLSGARHNIAGGTYTFNHDLTNAAERFELHFIRKSGVSIQETEQNNVYVGSTGNQVTVGIKNPGTYTIEVIDLLGRTIQPPVTFNNTGNQSQNITVNGITAGYYLVKVQGTDVLETKKVFLR